MTLHQLKVFVTVAKLGSFTQASETLHISQPSLSSLVSGLARELGAKLFERLGNKMHLTAVGERVLLRGEEVLSSLEGIKEEISELQGLKKGKIRVGGSALAAASFLPVTVERFKKEHPEIDLKLKIQRSQILKAQLLEGTLDVGFLSWPARSTQLIDELYRQEEVVVIAPRDHPLAKRRSASLELIAKEQLIVQENGIIRDLVQQKFAARGLSLRPALEVDIDLGGRDAIRTAVASGIGIGFIAKSHVTGDIKAGRVRVLDVSDLNLKRPIYLTFHKSLQKNSLVQAFLSFSKGHSER